MTKKKLVVLILLIFTNEFVYAQFDKNKINLLVGYTRNYHIDGLADKNFAINPELQIEGEIINSISNWSIIIGYWDDNIKGPDDGVSDLNVLFSYSNLIIGARLYYFSESINQAFTFMDLSFLIGLTHNFVTGKNILPEQIGLTQKKEFELNIAEIGVRTEFDLSKKINLLSEYSFKFHLNSKDFVLEDTRNSFKIGVLLSF